MDFIETKFADAWLIKPQVYGDSRGFFLESYSKKEFLANGIKDDFVQDNHSLSEKKGVLRGLHFQSPPHAQSKLVRVAKGSVQDVIVDLRKTSKTFGQWESFVLDDKEHAMLYIPRGFAHAMCTLEPATHFLYKVDGFYAPESDAGIIWDDPTLNIKWSADNPILSDKDQKLPQFAQFESPF